MVKRRLAKDINMAEFSLGGAHYSPTTVKAQDTAFTAEVSLNKAGFCIRHNDVQLRKEKKNILGGERIDVGKIATTVD